jgi:hypothetical protein
MRFVLVLAVVASLATALMATAKADAIATCAVPPVPPVACSSQDAHCICDAAGNCHWVYDCTQR